MSSCCTGGRRQFIQQHLLNISYELCGIVCFVENSLDPAASAALFPIAILARCFCEAMPHVGGDFVGLGTKFKSADSDTHFLSQRRAPIQETLYGDGALSMPSSRAIVEKAEVSSLWVHEEAPL